jgi:hypothetical protein
MLPLSATWESPIDLNGLDPEDRRRISEVGFQQWCDEITQTRPTLTYGPGGWSRSSRRGTVKD